MRPLDKLRVLELGEGVSAAYCTMLLADLGADVLKVEKPGGDVARRMGPFPDDKPDLERSGAFLYLNRNKRSMTLDYGTPSGQDILCSLASDSDVIVENLPAGTLDALGIGYEVLSANHQSLVMTSITPFGQTGPYSNYKASEMVLFAMGGFMTAVGDITREPVKLGGYPMLYMGGLFGFSATMVAVYAAEDTGLGQQVDVAIMEGIAGAHAQAVTEYDYTGNVRNRGELRTPIPCADGYISFAVQAHQYPDLQRLILGEADDDEADVVERDRRRREGDMDLQMLIWAGERTKLDAYREAQEGHVPAAFLADAKDVFESPQLVDRGFFVSIPHPSAGTLLYPGAPAKLTRSEFAFQPAPRLGEHTHSVLQGLGLTEQEIEGLRAAGVV